MLALLTLAFILEVDDEEAAGTVAMQMEKNAQLNMASVLEHYPDVTADQVAEEVAWLGVSVAMIPEAIRA